MKSVVFVAGLALVAGAASADVYNDATGELFDNGFTHIDIQSVTVTNDSQYLYFEISNVGLVSDTNWGKYMIALDYAAGGATDNPWGPRPIDFNGVEIDGWIGTWADDGGSVQFGGEVYNYSGGAWNLLGATYNGDTNIAGLSAGTQMVQIAFADLGLSVGDTINFDVMSSGGGGGDPGVDHLSRADMATTDWSVGSVSGAFLSYTLVPAPGTAALMGLGGLVAVRRRR